MFFFVNKKKNNIIERVERYINEHRVDSYPVDVIHPELYEALASYSQVAFKPLARKLPKQLVSKIKDVLLRKTLVSYQKRVN